ncbi:MAG TPA: hypothetical protein VF690_19240 [Hymenobacter sp.]|jgi:hypothetical protein
MQRLLQFYHYTFYWGYEWSLRTDKAGDAAAIKGLIILCLCLYFNLFAGAIAGEWLLHTALVPANLPGWVLVVAGLAFLALHYRYLIHSGRFRLIAAEFDAWNADRRWYMNRRVILYMLFSVISLGLAAYLRKNFPNPLHLS